MGAGSVGEDAALAHEDDAADFWEDVAEVVGDEQDAGALLGEAAEGFAEAALGGEVECVGGLVEEELAGAVDQGAGDEDAAFFSGGHFADELLGEVGGLDAVKSFSGAGAHFWRDDKIGPEGGGGEEAGDDGVEAGGDGSALAGELGAEGAVGDDAEVLAELGEVPAVAAEDADVHAGLDDGIKLAGDGEDERGLAASVGAEDADMLAGADFEIDVVEDGAVSTGDVDLGEGEEGIGIEVGESHEYRVNELFAAAHGLLAASF